MKITLTTQTTDGPASVSQTDVPIEDVIPSLAGLFAAVGDHNVIEVRITRG